MEPLTLRYQLEAGELAEAAFDHTPTVRAQAARTKVLGVVALATGALLLTSSPTAVALLALGVLIFGLGTRVSIVRKSRWSFERTPFFTDPVTAVADDAGIRFRTPHSDLWYRWSNYAAVRDHGTGVALVMRGGTTMRWIPARAFADRAQQAAWAAAAEAARAATPATAQP